MIKCPHPPSYVYRSHGGWFCQQCHRYLDITDVIDALLAHIRVAKPGESDNTRDPTQEDY